MDVTIDRDVLRELLDRAAACADVKGAMPILGHIRLNAASDALAATATDLCVCYSGSRPAQVKTPGSICVPARFFKDIVGRMLPGAVRVTTDDTLRVSVKGTGARKADAIGGIDGDDFPALMVADGKGFDIPGAAMGDLLRLVADAMSDDFTRPHLAALHLEMQGSTLRAVATDGRQLRYAERTIEGMKADVVLLVPGTSVERIRPHVPSDGTFRLTTSKKGGVVSFTVARDVWATKLVDAKFPSYEHVVPSEWSSTITFERQPMLDAIGAIGLVLGKERKLVVRNGDGLLRLHAEGIDGQMDDEVPFTVEGKPPAFACNPDQLASMLRSMTGKSAVLRLSGELDPLMLHSPDEGDRYKGISMPWRI